VRNINTKIALSALSAVAATLLIGAGTYAYFSDVGTSNDNFFSSGTLDLKLSDDTVEFDQDNVTASFGGTDMAPGSCTAIAQLRAKNSGTVAGNHIEIAVVNNVTDNGADSIPNMDAFLRLETFRYDGGNLSVADSNGNSFTDLADLATFGVDDLLLTNLSTDHTIELQVCLDSTATNAVQGDSVDSDWTITLNQHSSQ